MGRVAWILVAVVLLSALSGGAVSSNATAERRDVRTASFGQTTDDGPPELTSGESYWAGQQVVFNASRIIENVSTAPRSNRTFRIQRVNEDGETVSIVSSFTVDTSGKHIIGTSGLSGRYVITYRGDPVFVSGGYGYLSNPPSGDAVTVTTSTWRVERQRLEASWSDASLYPGQITELRITSNRDRYTLAVSSEDVSFRNLTRLFPRDAFARNFDARRDEGVLLLEGTASSSFRINASPLPAGSYQFTFRVRDTITLTETGFDIQRPEGPRFLSVERVENVGDVVSARVKCTHCFLVVGSVPDRTLDLVELRDGNGDGVINVRINTRYAGINPAVGVPRTVDAYAVGPDESHRYTASEKLESRSGEGYPDDLGAVRNVLGLRSGGRNAVIPPGDLDLTLATSDYLVSREQWGKFRPPTGGQLVVRDETDVETVVLQNRSLEGIRTAVAANRFGTDPSDASLLNRSTVGDQIALGEFLVIKVDLTGVFGYLSVMDRDVGAVLDNDFEGIDLEIAPRGDHRSASELRLESASHLFLMPNEERIAVIVNTDSLRRNRIRFGVPYRVRFQLTGGGLDAIEKGVEDGYPYLPEGTVAAVNTTVTFVEPNATIDVPVAVDGPTPVTSAERIEVAGHATVAPGSNLDVRITAHDPFVWSTTTVVEVNAQREWSTTLPISDAPGDRFTISVSYHGKRMDSVRIELVDETNQTTPRDRTTPTDQRTRTRTVQTDERTSTRTTGEGKTVTTRTVPPSTSMGTTRTRKTPGTTSVTTVTTPGTTSSPTRTTSVSSPTSPPPTTTSDGSSGFSIPGASIIGSLPIVPLIGLAVLLGVLYLGARVLGRFR